GSVAQLATHVVAKNGHRQVGRYPVRGFGLYARERRIALRVLDQAEVLVAIQRIAIDVAIDAAKKEIDCKAQVSVGLAQTQVDRARGLLVQIGVALLISQRGKVYAPGVEFLRVRHAL